MHLDPRIGVLNSGRYYAFVDGYNKPEFVGSLEEVELRLGIRQPKAGAKKVVGSSRLYEYEVTVTPRVVAYSGGGYGTEAQTFGEYTERVDARTGAEAITRVRRARNEQEGRYGVKATYRAKRV